MTASRCLSHLQISAEPFCISTKSTRPRRAERGRFTQPFRHERANPFSVVTHNRKRWIPAASLRRNHAGTPGVFETVAYDGTASRAPPKTQTDRRPNKIYFGRGAKTLSPHFFRSLKETMAAQGVLLPNCSQSALTSANGGREAEHFLSGAPLSVNASPCTKVIREQIFRARAAGARQGAR